jgi:hypothetical protein
VRFLVSKRDEQKKWNSAESIDLAASNFFSCPDRGNFADCKRARRCARLPTRRSIHAVWQDRLLIADKKIFQLRTIEAFAPDGGSEGSLGFRRGAASHTKVPR